MENVDIVTRIQQMQAHLTAKERVVAAYVLQNPEKVVYTSITSLAEDCGVADSTVFRFCRSLRVRGYQEFKLLLAQSIQLKNLIAEDVSEAIGRADDLEQVITKTYESDRLALKETRERMNPASLSRAVDLLVGARKVLVCGVGASLITGLSIANRFLRISDKFLCHLDAHHQAMAASLLQETDILLATSFSGATLDIVQIAEVAKKRGVRVISITSFEKSPLARSSDVILLCGAHENPFQGGSVSGSIAQMLLLDVLYNEYYRRTFDVSEANRTETATSVLTKLY